MLYALLLALALGQPRQQKPPAQRQQPAADQRGTAQSPLVVQSVPSEPTQEARQAERDHAKYEQRIANGTVALAFLTGALFLATAVLARYTWRLWRGAEETAKKQLRAYVLIDKAEVSERNGVPAYPRPAAYRLIVKNFGQTPAHRVGVVYRMGVGPFEEGAMDFGEEVPPDRPGSRPTLGPGHSSYNLIRPDFSAEHLALLLRPDKTLYILGRITFTDAFGEKRWSNFRLVREAGGHVLNTCMDGNESSDY